MNNQDNRDAWGETLGRIQHRLENNPSKRTLDQCQGEIIKYLKQGIEIPPELTLLLLEQAKKMANYKMTKSQVGNEQVSRKLRVIMFWNKKKLHSAVREYHTTLQDTPDAELNAKEIIYKNDTFAETLNRIKGWFELDPR